MDYHTLISQIDKTYQTLQQYAVRAINTHLTLRNWQIGYYMVDFEQNGKDRSKYGSKLLKELAVELKVKNIKTNERELRNIRNFYYTYFLFIDFISFLPIYNQISNKLLPIRKSVTTELETAILGLIIQESENKMKNL